MADDTDAFLDSLGKRGPPAAAAKGHDDTDTFLDSLGTPTAGEKSWTQTIRGWTDPTPVLKGAAGELEKAAEIVPGIKGSRPAEAVKGWAESGQDEETAGGFKRGVGAALPFLFQPELGVEAAATRGMVAAQPWLSQLARTSPTLGKMAQTASKAIPTVGRVVERAGTGAIAGEIQNPDDPWSGVIGAVGGLAPTTLNALVQNPATQYVLRHKFKHALGIGSAAGLHSVLGPLGYFAYPAMAARGPLGRGIDRAGHWIADRYGKVVGFIPERVARAIAAAGGTTTSQAFGGGDGQETSQTDQTQGSPIQ